MLICNQEKVESIQKLSQFIGDQTVLSDSCKVGFDSESGYAGMARRTFSLVLTRNDVDFLYQRMSELYQRIREDINDTSDLPFDALRCDAFYDATSRDLKILEINTRSVSMNDFTEWLDKQVAAKLDLPIAFSLNTQLTRNQSAIHRQIFGDTEPALYIAKRINDWVYLPLLKSQYDNLTVSTDVEHLKCSSVGVVLSGQTFRAIIKHGIDMPEGSWELDQKGMIKILQPRVMRPIGEKDYLTSLDLECVARSRPFETALLPDYIASQQSLVLKQNDSSGARGVIIGPQHDGLVWRDALQVACLSPAEWTMQDFVTPPMTSIYTHGASACQARTQLSIFLLPDANQPNGFRLDFYARAYVGAEAYFAFDPASHMPDLWFGNVIVTP